MTRIAHRVRNNGFTLIELMIVVAVIAILASIAIPNYSEYVLRSKLVDAGSSLAQMRVNLEHYYQDNRSYDAVPAAPGGTCGIAVADTKYFTYSCATSDGQDFTITATGKTTGGAADFKYTIDQGNNRKTTAMATGWGTAPALCWVSGKGQTC